MTRRVCAMAAAFAVFLTAPVFAEPAVPSPLIVAFQRQKNPEAVQASARRVAEVLSERLDHPVEVLVPASYGATVQALISNRAQVGYVSAIPYLLARQEAPVRIALAELRDGKTTYDSIFVVRRDSPHQTLEDLRGTRMMFTSPTSTSGYVMPFSRLVNDGFLTQAQDPSAFFGRVSFAGSYDRALLAVLNRQADAAAVSDYTMDGATADLYLNEQQREQLRILTRTEGVPTHLIAMRSDLPETMQEAIIEAFLAISEEHPELLADVYGAASFERVGEDHMDSAVQALSNTGLGARSLVE